MADDLQTLVATQLDLAVAARAGLWVSEGGFSSEAHRLPEALAHDLTFACQSRCVELFDDSFGMLKRGRIPASAVLARSLLETIGFMTVLHSVVTVDENDGDSFARAVERMANSSSFKFWMQKHDGPRDGEVYTEEARARFGVPRSRPLRPAEDAISGLEAFLNSEIGEGKGGIAFTMYSALSEWSHPSQNSLMHAYTNLGAAVPSSLGVHRPIEFARHLISWSLAQIWIVSHCRERIVPVLGGRLGELGVEVECRVAPFSPAVGTS